MNLILNAHDAMVPAGGILTIRGHDGNDAVRIEVCDTGCGIEPQDMDRIFEVFFTTKKQGNDGSRRYGVGLGLAFCKKIIDEHCGAISIESEPSKGSSFRITLPKRQ
jgi:signal transduction histidine kinase